MEGVQANGEVHGHHHQQQNQSQHQQQQQEVEETAPLSEQEMDLIQDTWAIVFQNSEAAGVAVLIRLFTKFPTSKQYFKDFKDMEDPDEMAGSAQFKKHAVRVINAINTLVENIHNGSKVASILTMVAKGHAVRHKVDPVYFKFLGGVILEVLVEAFPDTFQPAEVQGAWSKLMVVLYTHVTGVYAELGLLKALQQEH
ncbi:cytoglobin-1-like [Engraulis encrasicolus]|uniref:cytoglobin-1-like n=1 Tax=Engraulis encrasicolus TaxID=184585 RepID=UPI002FD3D16F